ncbi:MAG: histidine decarboxylase [Methylohalobius sp. ZOD2]
MPNSSLPPNVQARLEALTEQFSRGVEQFLGYPCNARFDYRPLYPFLSYPLNNAGDPFIDTHNRLNTHDIERQVVYFFAELFHARREAIWGYVTGGGTEGNLYGLFLGREQYPEGIVYYSEDSHYSIPKILKLLRMRQRQIKSTACGEMDYGDLARALNGRRDAPAIVLANIGTTMKGAVDDLERIHAVFESLSLRDYHIHADAAFHGMILPFVDRPPVFDFQAGIDSIAVSGHKILGAPVPCGVVLAKKVHVRRIARMVEYVGSLDSTIPGSRSGLTPLMLWYAIETLGRDGFRALTAHCLEMAEYAVERFNGVGISAWRNPHSPIVVFPRMAEPVLRRWQIAVHAETAHLVTVGHVEKRHIDTFLEEILNHESDHPGHP